MNSAFRALDILVDSVLAIFLAGTVVILAVGVWYRYVLNDSLGWTDEIGSHLLVWLTFLGAYPCFRKQLHLDFPMLVHALPEHGRRWLMRALAFAMALFCLFVAWESWKVLAIVGHNNLRSLPMARGWFMAALPISFLLMALADTLQPPATTDQ
jgi:TRAP-type C4-dicarboxylate transport system permease small subunit